MAEGKRDSSEIGPAYLIAGTDQGKLDATLTRLRLRAEKEGGVGSLESFSAPAGSSAGPDGEALAAAVPAMSLTATRRYLVADGVERWSAKQAAAVIGALAALPPDVTIVLVARERSPREKAPKALFDAVEAAGGEVLRFEAPKLRDLPRWLTGEARRRGFELEDEAARLLCERLGDGTTRLATELDRLSVWAGEGGSVTAEDLESMIADTSEEVVWALSDAIVDRNPAAALDAVEAAGGEVLRFEAPKPRDLPRWLTGEARRRGFELEGEAARLLCERLGDGTTRLATELDRLSVWAGDGGSVTAEDLESMIADTSEEVVWALSDAIVDRNPAAALDAAERLSEQGEGVTPLVYQAAKRLREAHAALEMLDAGKPAREVEAALPMHPYAAKMLLRRLDGRRLDEVRAATCAIADLEWWTRGGADYPERVALTLAVRRAAGPRG